MKEAEQKRDSAQPNSRLVQSEKVFDKVSEINSSIGDIEESQSTAVAAVN